MADTELGLTAPIKDGKVENSTSSEKTVKKHGEMGKDEFLQLLVAQMKYQDPLEPTDNTQYVSQLATFSSLEQMQNLNQTTVNTQAFTLVGKEVIMETTSATGNTTYKQGVVDYVTLQSNKAYLSIEGKLYSADDLYSVIGDDYIVSQKVPTVEETTLIYDMSNPEDTTVNITLGKDEFEASMVAVFINGETVPSEHLKYEEGKLTISKDAFKNLDAGTYKVAFMFNDALTTTYTDKVTLRVKGIKQESDQTEGDQTEGEASGTA